MSIPKDKHGLIFTARMNVIYHERRESFYSKCLNWSSFVSVIFSSAAFVAIGDLFPDVIKKEILVAIFASTVACLNGAILAFGVTDKVKLHSNYKMKWMEMLKECQHIKEDEKESVQIMIDKIMDLSASEPPPNQNELVKSYKLTKHFMRPNQDEIPLATN